MCSPIFPSGLLQLRFSELPKPVKVIVFEMFVRVTLALDLTSMSDISMLQHSITNVENLKIQFGKRDNRQIL